MSISVLSSSSYVYEQMSSFCLTRRQNIGTPSDMAETTDRPIDQQTDGHKLAATTTTLPNFTRRQKTVATFEMAETIDRSTNRPTDTSWRQPRLPFQILHGAKKQGPRSRWLKRATDRPGIHQRTQADDVLQIRPSKSCSATSKRQLLL